MKDRLIGYSVIAALICFLIVPILYLRWKASEPVVHRTIAFSHVRSLSLLTIEDPVRVRGVDVGMVRKITTSNDTVFVTIETSDDVLLHENYSIDVVAKGVMGDRFLTIQPGDARRPLVKTDAILYGTVNMSPDDALSYIRDLQKAVRALVTLTGELKTGTARKPSLISRIRQFATDIDSAVVSINTILTQLDTSFQSGLAAASSGLDGALAVSQKVSTELPTAAASVTATIVSLEEMLQKVDLLIAEVSPLVEKATDPDMALWKKSTSSIQNDLSELQKLLRSIQLDTLTLPVRLW